MPSGPEDRKARGGQDPADPFATVPPFMSSSSNIDPAHAPPRDTGAPVPVSVKPGQVLFGLYFVKRKLGAGGMGSVWLVEDQFLKTDRALKLIASGLTENPQARARFQREAQVMAMVKHEHAVTVHTAQLFGDTAAIVMEYIGGQSIDHLLKPGQPRPLDWVAQFLSQLCAVLQVAHDQGIVHRDLKPSNLMLVAEQPGGSLYLKVLDFGLAKILGSEANDPIIRSTGAMGTVAYLSPEQALGKEVDTRSDIYSVGVILYEFLVGQRPFDGQLYQVMNDHVKTPPPPFKNKNPNSQVPPAIERVVMQCLEKDPARRPASARALAEAFLKAIPKPVTPPPIPKLKVKLKLKPKVLVWAAAAGGVLALAFVLGLVYRSSLKGHRRVAIRVQPSSARVLVNGTNRPLDKDGILNLDFAGTQPLSVRVTAEGCSAYFKRLTYEEAARPGFEVRLELDGNTSGQVARSFLKKYCYRCHGVDFDSPALDVLDHQTLVSLSGSASTRFVEPYKPAESAVWQQIEQGKMPPANHEQPTDAEKSAFRSWIEAGAAPARGPRRPFQSDESVREAIRQDLASIRSTTLASYQRYFVFTNIYNNPTVLDEELQVYRAALSKAINSLHREPAVVQPKQVDSDGTIYRIDLSDVHWAREGFWNELVQQYPYGLPDKRGSDGDPEFQTICQGFEDLSTSRQPYVRADWFIATATLPPLYHEFLELPNSAAQLEREQRIDINDDFNKGRSVRAGVINSGVAHHNRLLERHSAPRGYYWKSYDFRGASAQSDLLRYPLGPVFEGNEFAEQAFIHNRSAIMFRLPNGLQAYLLVNAEGNRIESIETDVLSDPQAVAGTSEVFNGLSCIACHRLGIKNVTDNVRGGNNLADKPREKVDQLYQPQHEINRHLLSDGIAFRDSLSLAIEPILLKSDDRDAPSAVELPEPIGFVARRFHSDLGIGELACELGVENADNLLAQLRDAPQIRTPALEPLLHQSRIKRKEWESSTPEVSPYHRVFAELRRQQRAHKP